MARIADEVIERIKAEVSLVRLVASQGYELVKQGKDFALCCPFHEDKTPSCIISPVSNLFNCFGCGAGGSVVDWVMKTQGVSFRHAVELLKNDIADSSSLVASSEPIKKTTVPKLAAPVSVDADDQTLLREVVDYYHETLMDSVEGIAYLEARGLADGTLMKHFKLGYANRTLGLRLPQKNRKTGAELREKLQRIESEVKEKHSPDKLTARRQQSQPIIDKLKSWLDKSIAHSPPESAIGKALYYLHEQWPRLIRYLDSGDYPIDNNAAENAIRPFVVGRKNWLFSASQKGATSSAHLYSLIETAKANGLEPYTYLKKIFTDLPKATSVEDIENCLPWN